MSVRVGDFVAKATQSPLAHFATQAPWAWTANAADIVRALLASCGDDYEIHGDVAVHRSATVEPGALVKGPALIGPNCFIASTALLRGGCWMEEGCIIGPSAELKTSFLFGGAKLAHLNFVGDSVLGADVNVEAGAMIANHRNERADKRIRIRVHGAVIDTGVEKFGALVGDGARIGANAVIAPGALLAPGAIVARLSLVDQGA
jgi:NDP-sugar pyrophosphorylase family protein